MDFNEVPQPGIDVGQLRAIAKRRGVDDTFVRDLIAALDAMHACALGLIRMVGTEAQTLETLASHSRCRENGEQMRLPATELAAGKVVALFKTYGTEADNES